MTYNKDPSYLNYAHDRVHQKQYSQYQKRYAKKLRESDRVLIQLIGDYISKSENKKQLSLLDIGCSTGNLLYHLRNEFPDLDLFGGDLSSEIIQECKLKKELAGIRFEEMDLLDMSFKDEFDIVVANVILFVLQPKEFKQAIRNIYSALKVGGRAVIFDLFHPFEQEVSIIEKSKLHPSGLYLHFRSYLSVRKVLDEAGFSTPLFKKFKIPIDLEFSNDFSDITSYTIQPKNGERMNFRGTLFLPWCHLTVDKPQ